MTEVQKILKGYLSRKWLISVAVMGLTYQLPVMFQSKGISDSVTLAALALIAGIGVSYGIVNVKDSKPQ